MENYSGWLGELSWLARGVKLKQLRTCLTYASSTYASSFSLLPMPPPNANTTLSLQLPMKFGNIVGWKPHDINDTAEAKFLQPSIRLRYNYYVQLVATKRDWMRVPNLKSRSARQRHAIDCRSYIYTFSRQSLNFALSLA